MKKTNVRWIIQIVVTSLVISMVFTFASAEILGNVGRAMAFAVLAVFIALGVVFDILGVATTTATPAPFHSMASHRERGAAEALWLLKNAEKVSSICNDVVGDISGIVSGATAATIAAGSCATCPRRACWFSCSSPGCGRADHRRQGRGKDIRAEKQHGYPPPRRPASESQNAAISQKIGQIVLAILTGYAPPPM